MQKWHLKNCRSTTVSATSARSASKAWVSSLMTIACKKCVIFASNSHSLASSISQTISYTNSRRTITSSSWQTVSYSSTHSWKLSQTLPNHSTAARVASLAPAPTRSTKRTTTMSLQTSSKWPRWHRWAKSSHRSTCRLIRHRGCRRTRPLPSN